VAKAEQPVHVAARHRIVAAMKKRPRHHRSAGSHAAGSHAAGSHAKTANAARTEHHAPAVVDQAAAHRVKALVAAKLGNPDSLAFQDIVAGRAADSFCGVAQVKGAAGEREMPFVVQGSRTYIIDGSDDRSATAAIQNMCD
jgi:hypothetical protein